MPETNVEKITRIMERSQNGSIMQGFIVSALVEYSKKVDKAEPSEIEHPLIAPGAWKSCAEEVLAEFQL